MFEFPLKGCIPLLLGLRTLLHFRVSGEGIVVVVITVGAGKV